jgi:cellulose synthase/poly-beta-1,6-N-acetylglucosamine synthase-like glycosyltransferase
VFEAEKQGQKFPDVMPVLDQISQNSGFEKVVGYPIYLRIMGNLVARRLLAVVIFLILVAFPMTELVILVYQFLYGGENFFRVIIWIAYTFITASIFIKMMGITTKT